MKENLEQKQSVNETIVSRAAAPGAPGGTTTPIYLQEYPAEASNDTTKYDNKNAIWDSGTDPNTYKNISFGNSLSGLQFRAGGHLSTGMPSAPGGPLITDLFVRSKDRTSNSYSEWYEIYHTGNLNRGDYATKYQLNLKADKTYVDSKLAAIPPIPDISSKADKTYVDNELSKKADQSDVDHLRTLVLSKI